jgi:uroporphyrinogen decarboxylase
MMTGLTPKERIANFLSGKPVDCVPCVPLILNHAARVLGVKISQYATDGATMGDAQVAAWRRYRHDLITIFTDTCILAEAMGTELYFPDDDVPRVKTPVVVEPRDVEKLGRIDVRAAGRLPVCIEAVRRCVGEVGGEVFVSCCLPAPFSNAAALRGTAILARDLYKNPGLAHALLEKSLEALVDVSAAVVEAGGIPVLVDPVASGSVLSRKAFEEFALPYLRRAFGAIKALGAAPILHICGRTSGLVDLMPSSGAIALSLDQIDLAEAIASTGGSVCIMGNVKPAETLLGGTPETVRREARRCIETGKTARGGFILASGCEVPIETPPENIDALIFVARGG